MQPPRPGLFSRVPAPIFAPVLGLLGLVTACRHGRDVFQFPTALVEVFAGVATAIFVFCTVCYLLKFMMRAGVLIEDLATLPGRTGIAAFFVAFMVLAAVLAPYSDNLARASLAFGATCFVALALYILSQRLAGTDTTGPATPAMHLVFVGIVVAPGAAVPLGMAPAVIPLLVWYCLFAAIAVAWRTFGDLLTGNGPPVLRPLQTIHLAPPAFVSTGAFLTGQHSLAWGALILAALVMLVLVFRLRWMVESGFSSFWSAFTFPMTAFAGAVLTAAEISDHPVLRLAGGAALVLAMLITLSVAYRVMKLWASGELAAKTNAAIA